MNPIFFILHSDFFISPDPFDLVVLYIDRRIVDGWGGGMLGAGHWHQGVDVGEEGGLSHVWDCKSRF